MSIYYYYATPPLYFFPRSRNMLLEEEDKEIEGVKTKIEKCELKNILKTYEDDKNYSLNNKYSKKIESKIFLDLWHSYSDNTYTVEKKCCLGLFKNIDGKNDFMNKDAKFLCVELYCEVSNEDLSVYLKNEINDNKEDNTKPLMINLNEYDDHIRQFSIVIEYKDDISLPNNSKVTLKARYSGHKNYEKEIQLDLYRNTENSLEDFQQNSENKDTDFFVIPRFSPNNFQSKCLKELKVINNQVLARNAKMNNNFNYLKEDGSLDNIEQLMHNIYSSKAAFKTDPNNLEKGCRTGKRILGSSDKSEILCNYPYNFDNFGQAEDLIKYLAASYNILDNDLYRLIIDRNYLFGNYHNGDSQDKIEGVQNLYDFVVTPFISSLIQNAESYLNFNRRWLTCPRYNTNYQRGNYTVPNGTTKQLIKMDGSTELISAGSVIAFKQGPDLNAFDENGYSEYDITSINGEPKNGKILLNLFEKQQCDDRRDENYSDYAINDNNVTEELDELAINQIASSNGIPYYMNQLDSVNNADSTKLKTNELLSWNENKKNWFLYEKKPNTSTFGIDCSGLVTNSLESFIYSNNIFHFTSKGSYFQNYVGCNKINSTFVRQISTPLIQSENNSIIKNGDCLICDSHVVLVDTDNNNVSVDDYNNRKIQVIHNYYGFNGNQTEITLFSDNRKYTKGYWCRTLKGPYRHAGITTNSTSIGRFYLWY